MMRHHKRVKESTWLNLFLRNGESLSPIEEAEAFYKLHKKYGMNVNTIASKTNRSNALVSNRIKLATAPLEIKEKIENGEIKVNKVMSSLPKRKYIKKNNNKEKAIAWWKSWYALKHNPGSHP